MELPLFSVREREEAGEPVGADPEVRIGVPGSKGLFMENLMKEKRRTKR